MTRKTHLAAIHASAKKLGWSDAQYRVWLYNNTGEKSAGDMNDDQLEQTAAKLRRLLPAAPAPGPGEPTARQWGSLKSILKQHGYSGLDDARFVAFVKRTAKIDHPKHLSRAAMTDVISGLMRMHRRT